MTKFTPDTVSADEDAINGCLRHGDCCLELLGESPEEKEYLRQIEQVYFECGATNFRQAHFFLTLQTRLQAIEELTSRQDSRTKGIAERIRESELSRACGGDPVFLEAHGDQLGTKEWVAACEKFFGGES